MSERDDGGPAFPRSGTDGTEGYPGVSEQSGMTLRDWFAGQAMNGFASDPSSHDQGERKMTIGHNSASYDVVADELRQFIERIETVEEEMRGLRGDRSEIYAEAKGRGYDTKVLRKIVALRKRRPEEIAEEEAVTEMYKGALGMS